LFIEECLEGNKGDKIRRELMATNLPLLIIVFQSFVINGNGWAEPRLFLLETADVDQNAGQP
jgi:hypothetical protein